MYSTTFHRLGLGLAVLVALFTLASSAEAGPPLICHPFEIGNANSLPWGNSQNWKSPKEGYDIAKLSAGNYVRCNLQVIPVV